MSTQAQITRIRARHQDHAGNPGIDCDACRLLRLLDQHREGFDRIQELVSKAQWDAAAFTGAIKAARGLEPAGPRVFDEVELGVDVYAPSRSVTAMPPATAVASAASFQQGPPLTADQQAANNDALQAQALANVPPGSSAAKRIAIQAAAEGKKR